MQQLEFLIVRVGLRSRRSGVADEKAMTWGDLPAQARTAVIEHVAEMLRAHLECDASVEVDDCGLLHYSTGHLSRSIVRRGARPFGLRDRLETSDLRTQSGTPGRRA